MAGNPLLAERLLELRRHRFVFHRHQPREQLENRDLAAEPAKDGGELDAHGAAAHDGDRLRHFSQVHRFVARNDAPAIDLDPRHASRRRPGRDDDLLPGAQRLRVALEDVHAAAAGEPRRPFDPRDLVLLEQILDPLGQTADDLVLARVDLRHVDADRNLLRAGRRPSDGDAPLPGVLDDLHGVGVLEERLGRNAADQQAGAAERLLLLDDGDAEAELGGADGRDVAAGSGADHDQVVLVGHGM
jgi:hypothetical protein